MPDAAITNAYEAYLDADVEPPFSEYHYRNHTPAQPDPDCAHCRWLGWYQSEDGDLKLFTAGWRAASPEQMVRQFHAGCQQEGGGWSSASLRHDLFMSEVKEFNDAVAANDLVEVADAIADITYVLIGTAIELGIPFDAVFREVHRSNMTKLIPPVAVREDGKVCKGPHFDPPRIAQILADGGPFTPMYKGDPRGGGNA